MKKCNACGRTFSEYDYEYGTNISGYVPVNKVDLEYARVNVDLCSECFETLVNSFENANMKDIKVSNKEPEFVSNWTEKVDVEGIFSIDREDFLRKLRDNEE